MPDNTVRFTDYNINKMLSENNRVFIFAVDTTTIAGK